MLPSEGQIAQFVILGLLFSMSFMMIKAIHDQNSYNAKRKNDSNSHKKSFKDVGGCESAKKAIFDILDFLKRPKHY